MRILTAAAMTLAMMVPAQAWTLDGYMTAGGVGQLRCTDFQNALGEARAVGLNSRNGIERMNPFIQYAFGYYTSYNMTAQGIYDLLDPLRGDTMVVGVLTVLDNWCDDNPLKDFNDALSASIDILLPTALREKRP